jgi:hypothetical protein
MCGVTNEALCRKVIYLTYRQYIVYARVLLGVIMDLMKR